jgi:hypothetical protein
MCRLLTPLSRPGYRTSAPSQLATLSPRCGALPFFGAFVRLGSGGLGPHHSVVEPRLVAPFGTAQLVRPGRLLRVDLAARARELANLSISGAISGDSHVVPGFALPRTLPINSGFWCGKPIAFPFLCFCDRPELSSARRHSCEGSGELGRLPPGVYPMGRPACSLGPCGLAWGAALWRPRSIRPMSAAHGFCFQNDRPLVSAHSAPHVPRGTGAIGSRRWSRFGEPADVHGEFSSPRPSSTSTERFVLRDRSFPAYL